MDEAAETAMGRANMTNITETLNNLLSAYRLLGIGSELGAPGDHTAFVIRNGNDGECVELHVLPGRFERAEIDELMHCACSRVAPVAYAKAA